MEACFRRRPSPRPPALCQAAPHIDTERESHMPNLGGPELLIILAIVLLLFGATRLPKLGKGLGQSIRGFKKGLNEETPDEIEEPEQAEIEKGEDETKS
jgi:sec-independent protein translocase protein TatA